MTSRGAPHVAETLNLNKEQLSVKLGEINHTKGVIERLLSGRAFMVVSSFQEKYTACSPAGQRHMYVCVCGGQKGGGGGQRDRER